MVNESLRISEDESSTSTTGNPAPPSTPSSGNTVSPGNKMPGVPSVKLQVIANSLNTHLTQLLVRRTCPSVLFDYEDQNGIGK